MKLGQRRAMDIESVSTGSLSLDLALGIGGLPKGRIVEVYGPESSGKTTLALQVVATAMAARLGNVDVAAHEIGFQAWFFLSMSMDAIAIAAQAITGNLLGAGNAHEARQMGRRAIIWSTGLGCFIGSILAIFHLSFAEIFSEDTAVVELAGFLLLHVAAMAPLSGVAFALDGILIGAGDQRFLAKAMSFSAVISVPLMLLSLAFGLGIGWIWGSIWILMLTRSTTLYIRFRSDKWQKLGS